jgi:HK97 family phage portal protein
MRALTKSINTTSEFSEMVRTDALQMKGGSEGVLVADSTVSATSVFGDQGKYKHRYSLFKGWLYSAINVIGEKAAGQGVNVGRFTGEMEEEERSKLSTRKTFLMSKMPKTTHSKVVKHPNLGVELLNNSPILDVLEKPNDIQNRWQFVYSFVANLAITGWSFIIIDTNDEGGLEFFSFPTTWVTPLPDKSGKPFSKFKIRNPKKGHSEGQILDKEHVAFAYLPNPSDPLAALSPASAQIEAIKIDDKIQASQGVFFDNGIFPSAIVHVGKNPHPEVTGGIRPRLTNAQRHQIHGVIKRMMQGIANYGQPAILDGYIEKITKLSMNSTEMGWDKSEDKIRSRILSAYSIHPYMLGEPVGVGGYAQVAGIERVFCGKVNTYLDMLGNVLSNKLIDISNDEKLLVWWDKCEPLDPNIRNRMMVEGRKNNDVTRNEYRAELGFSPMDEGSDRSRLVGDQVAMSSLLNALGNQGLLNSDTLSQLLRLFLGITEEEANNIAGSASGGNEQELLEEIRNVLGEMKKPIVVDLDSTEIKQQVDNIFKRNQGDDDDDFLGALVPNS